MRIILFVFITGLLVASCGSNVSREQSSSQSDSSNSTSTYMPVTYLMQDDITHVDSFATAILSKQIKNGETLDSGYIDLPAFHKLTASILPTALADSAWFKNNFKETSLVDESTGLINFIYTPVSADEPLRKVVVYIAPNPNSTESDVKRIYMEREYSSGDTAYSQKVTWRMKEYCMQVTIAQPASGQNIVTVDKLIWDPVFFSE